MQVAGICVAAASSNDRLIQALRRRYETFLPGDLAQVQVTAEISLETEKMRTRALPEPRLLFRGGTLIFDDPGYQGFVDIANGQASLWLDSSQPIAEIDYFIRAIYALAAFQRGGLMFHAAGIVRRGWGYVFFGHSGSGKTTVAGYAGPGKVLNDDLLILMPGEGGWQAHATPFWNPTQVRPAPGAARIGGLFRLVQDQRVALEPLAGGQALAELLASAPVVSADPGRALALVERGTAILSAIPVQRLHFRKDDSFWALIDSLHPGAAGG
jgi:hypothetical protein